MGNGKKWVKLNLFYIGKSKKHEIFRVKRWNTSLEKINKKDIFNQNYEKIGHIKDIFGPIKAPFISIKMLPNVLLIPNDTLFTKI